MEEYTMESMEALAASRGGRFVSKIYKGIWKKHTWCCAEGHVWNVEPFRIINGSWCRECFRDSQNQSLREKVEAIIKQRGGECLSDVYKARGRISLRCKEGHVFHPRVRNVVYNKTWCPTCGQVSAMNSLRKRKGNVTA